MSISFLLVKVSRIIVRNNTKRLCVVDNNISMIVGEKKMKSHFIVFKLSTSKEKKRFCVTIRTGSKRTYRCVDGYVLEKNHLAS